jgi:hypothetical protein
MIGLFETQSGMDFVLNINTSYTIANIIANKSEDITSYIGGIVARAQNISGTNLEDEINLPSALYLANFMIDTNSIGIALGVEDLLFSDKSSDYFKDFDATLVWSMAENKYPVLRWITSKSQLVDYKLSPVVVSEINASVLSSNLSIIIDEKLNTITNVELRLNVLDDHKVHTENDTDTVIENLQLEFGDYTRYASGGDMIYKNLKRVVRNGN